MTPVAYTGLHLDGMLVWIADLERSDQIGAVSAAEGRVLTIGILVTVSGVKR